MKLYARLACLVLVLAVASGSPASAAADAKCTSPPECGRAFEPTPMTTPQYGLLDLDEDGKPDPSSVNDVTTPHGLIHLETYLPQPTPERVPTILQMTPYYVRYATNDPGYTSAIRWREFFVRRGYAYTIGHVLGTGYSEGCIDLFGTRERQATAHAIYDLGTKAPWSNGRIGMIGQSYDGGTALGAATLAGNSVVSPVEDKTYAELVAPLKAIVTLAAETGRYENTIGDLEGVTVNPGAGTPQIAGYLALTADPPHDDSCFPAHFAAVAEGEATGNYSPYFAERDYRKDAGSVRAATLIYHGFGDMGNVPKHVVGFFDRLPATTPHGLLMGRWAHGTDTLGFAKPHLLNSYHAWFDRHLMELPTGTEGWPRAQVVDWTGQWRGESTWPQVVGTPGQLALDGSGLACQQSQTLDPDGCESYQEVSTTETSGAVFRSEPLQKDLRMSGVAVLDVWVRVPQPAVGDRDAHVATTVRILQREPDGSEVLIGRPLFGARSIQHLDPMPGDYFKQETPHPPERDEVRVPIRLWPEEVVAPAGSIVELKIGGVLHGAPAVGLVPTSAPSGATGTVTILHDCAHPSALRFLMPSRNPDWLNVREAEDEELTSTPSPTLDVDGGLAERPVCGRAPVDPFFVTRGGGPTAALLVSFGGTARKDGVALRWRTEHETEIAGFHLFRGKAKLTRRLIAAKQSGRSAGATYRFLDRPERRGRHYTYRLEAVLLDGSRIVLATKVVAR